MNSLDKWQDRSFSRPERMRAFEKWLYDEIIRILWPVFLKDKNFGHMKYAGQWVNDTKKAVARMAHRGWFLDGPDLRNVIERTTLVPLRGFRDGLIEDIHAYMIKVFKNFPDSDADGLDRASKLAGTHISQLIGGVSLENNITDIVAHFQKESDEKKELKMLRKREMVEEDKKQLNLFT